MAVFIGISRKYVLLKLAPGQPSFWCVNKSNKAQPGDLLLLYIPESVSSRWAGIRQIYRITQIRDGRAEAECESRSMTTVDTELLYNLEKQITMKDMKADEEVSELGAVRRNMQGVIFAINDEIWPALRSLIISQNPGAESVL